MGLHKIFRVRKIRINVSGQYLWAKLTTLNILRMSPAGSLICYLQAPSIPASWALRPRPGAPPPTSHPPCSQRTDNKVGNNFTVCTKYFMTELRRNFKYVQCQSSDLLSWNCILDCKASM